VMGEDSIAEAPSSTPAQSQPAPDDLRSRLMAQFEQWLDQTLAGQPPPRGLPDNLLAEAAAIVEGQHSAAESDLYTLFSSLTALTGEIRLQGRAFKQLSDLLSPLSQTPAMLARVYEAQSETALSIQEALTRDAQEDQAPPVDFKQVCQTMIDLYDRLQRGLQTCDDGISVIKARHCGTWLRRLFGDAGVSDQAVLCVQGIRDAAALSLARLQSAMQDWGIERIGRVGETFDPNRMAVVEASVSSQTPGIVLLVNRSGYALDGAVKAVAQVTVSKPGI